MARPLAKSLKGLWEDALLGNAAALTGLTASESGPGVMRRTTLRFNATPFTLIDQAGVIAYKGQKVYDFPEGWIKIICATADMTVTKTTAGVNANFNGDFSVGTVTAAADGTLTATEANIIPSTATPAATAGVTTARGANAADIAPFDGHTTAVDLFLNFLVDDTDHNVAATPCDLLVSGTLTVHWLNAGDYA